MNDHFNKFLQTVTIIQASTLLSQVVSSRHEDTCPLNFYYGFCRRCPPYFEHHCMFISKLKNSGPKPTCTGPGPRDEVMVTGEYLGCNRTQVTLDTSHHNNHHAYYTISFTVSAASISSRELELRCRLNTSCVTCPGSVANGRCRQLAEITRIQSQ